MTLIKNLNIKKRPLFVSFVYTSKEFNKSPKLQRRRFSHSDWRVGGGEGGVLTSGLLDMVNNEYSLHRRRVKRRDSVVSAALRRHVCIEAPRVVPSGPMASAWDPIQAVLYQFIYILFFFHFLFFIFFFHLFIYFIFFFFGRVFLFLFSSCKDS